MSLYGWTSCFSVELNAAEHLAWSVGSSEAEVSSTEAAEKTRTGKEEKSAQLCQAVR